jgi:hypothetical protein
MKSNEKKTDYIFEISWEVCNKVGGIYTVLSTQAKALKSIYSDNLIYIGPDFEEKNDLFFIEDKKSLSQWVKSAKKNNLEVRVGRWNIPGSPLVILVDHRRLSAETNSSFLKWGIILK